MRKDIIYRPWVLNYIIFNETRQAPLSNMCIQICIIGYHSHDSKISNCFGPPANKPLTSANCLAEYMGD